MLVLSRQKNEAIVIGSDITVYVVSIEGNRVLLGFQTPAGTEVLYREEYVKRKRDEAEKNPDNET